MKAEELKLYNKYKHINYPNREYIYVGFDEQNSYCFLYKNKKYNTSFSTLKYRGLNPDKIVKDLNLEIIIDEYCEKHIKEYDYFWYKKEIIE